jgi:hypothetical protein
VTAAEIKKIVPPEFWDRAFKFASERHPYEKAVSLVYFRLGKQREKREKTRRSSRKRFPTILDRIVADGEYRGFEYYSIGGLPVVDEFIRHESLDADLRRVAARLGIAVPDELPRTKSGFRLKQKPARDILSDEQKCTVFEKCREEFELFGYER